MNERLEKFQMNWRSIVVLKGKNKIDFMVEKSLKLLFDFSIKSQQFSVDSGHDFCHTLQQKRKSIDFDQPSS